MRAQQFDLERELVEQWLGDVDNCSQPEHQNMMDFHLRCSLPLQKDFAAAKQFIENHSLDDEEKKVSIHVYVQFGG